MIPSRVRPLGGMTRTSLTAAIAAATLAATTLAAQDTLKAPTLLDAQGIQDAATDAGRDLEIIETNAQGDVSQESSFIDSLMSAGVEAIIVSAVSADSSFRSIRRAHDAGIPAVCYNTCLSEADEPDQQDLVSAYAVGDPYEFGATLGAARAVRSQGRVADVVVFGGDMTTEIAAELEQHDVIKAVVDISGQTMGRLAFAFAEAVKAIKGETDGEIQAPAQIDLHDTSEAGAAWLQAHPDGIP